MFDLNYGGADKDLPPPTGNYNGHVGGHVVLAGLTSASTVLSALSKQSLPSLIVQNDSFWSYLLSSWGYCSFF